VKETVFLSGIRFFYLQKNAPGSPMKIKLNGEDYITQGVNTVEDLLRELEINSGRVAVEVNVQVIRKADYGKFELHEGDAVEIVSFVGGG
jgi:sulfur carrier protein